MPNAESGTTIDRYYIALSSDTLGYISLGYISLKYIIEGTGEVMSGPPLI